MEKPDPVIAQQANPTDLITALGLVYLVIPFFGYFSGWFKSPWGELLAFITAAGLLFTLLKTGYIRNDKIWSQRQVYVVIILIGVLWALFGGAGHFFYANNDWYYRDAVLRDLTLAKGPPGYGFTEQGPVILRAPVAYFIPASILGKMIGLEFADAFLWLWTACGTVIFLALLPMPTRLSLRLILSLIIVIFFSGLDVVGMLLIDPEQVEPGQHLEWWAGLFQYSANTTQLFWVPNHALPAWIAIAMFYRHWRHPSFAYYVPMTFAVLPLWSPFAAIGMAPFYLLWLITQFRYVKWHLRTWLPAILILVATLPYLALSIHTLPASLTMEIGGIGFYSYISLYFVFVLFEYILIWLLVYDNAERTLWILTGAILLLLPFLRFGPGNDIVMRGSIPALMMLCIFTLLAIGNSGKLPASRMILLGGLLLVGSVTPMQEFIRAFNNEPWSPSFDKSLYQAAKNNLPLHYTATLSPNGLGLFMLEPDNLLSE